MTPAQTPNETYSDSCIPTNFPIPSSLVFTSIFHHASKYCNGHLFPPLFLSAQQCILKKKSSGTAIDEGGIASTLSSLGFRPLGLYSILNVGEYFTDPRSRAGTVLKSLSEMVICGVHFPIPHNRHSSWSMSNIPKRRQWGTAGNQSSEEGCESGSVLLCIH